MNFKRPRILKSTARAASGGVLVLAALMVLMFMRGNMGSGDGDDGSDPETDRGADSEAPAGTNLVTTDTRPAANELTAIVADNAKGGLTPEELQALSDNVLAVLIDEYSYLLEIPGDEATIYRPLDLKRLLQLAQQAEGDSNGIRVRILRRESARTNAEVDLRSALEDIGIGADAVYMPVEFVP